MSSSQLAKLLLLVCLSQIIRSKLDKKEKRKGRKMMMLPEADKNHLCWEMGEKEGNLFPSAATSSRIQAIDVCNTLSSEKVAAGGI